MSSDRAPSNNVIIRRFVRNEKFQPHYNKYQSIKSKEKEEEKKVPILSEI